MKTDIWMCIATVLMMAMGSLWLPPASAGPKGPVTNTDSEPNDDFANATEVIPGAGNTIKISGTGTSTNVEDYYKILLNRTGPNSEKLNVTSDVPQATAACRLFLYDPNARFMVLDGDANNNFDHTVETVAAVTGYYFAWLECIPLSGNTANYNITFTKTPVTGVTIENGTPATSTPILVTPTTVNGALNDPGDQADFYNISLVSDTFEADVVTFHAIPSGTLSMLVEVYMPNLTYVSDELHYSPVQNGQPAAGEVQISSFSAVVPGNYYIRVLAVFGQGTYSVRLMKTPVARDTFNSAETARGIPDFIDGHTLEFSDTLGKDIDNEDYFSFPASLGQIVNATIWSMDYNKTLNRPQMTMELRDSANQTYGDDNSTGVAMQYAYSHGESPESTQASLLHVSLLTYYGGAGGYIVNMWVDMKPTIHEGAWETDFLVNESSYAILNLSTVFTDPDGDPLNYTWVNNGEGKTMLNLPKGTDLANFSTLQGGWTGMENYTINATDQFGYSTQANIHVGVGAVNHAPYVKNWVIPDISADPGEILLTTLNLSKYFDDDDKSNPAINDFLTYHFKDASPLAITPQLIPGTLKHSGGITIQVPAMPELTMPMVVTVSFWACDTYNISTPELTCNITINPLVDKPPRWSSNFTELTMNESQTGKLTEAVVDMGNFCTDTDPWDRNNLTYTAKNYNVSVFAVNITRSIARIVPKTGFYTMPPHENITFNVTDTRGAGADKTVTLIVRHVYISPAPTPPGPIPPGTSYELDENTTLSFWFNVTADPQLTNLTPPPFKYRWFANGTLQTSAVSGFVLRTDFTSAARSPMNVTATFNDSYNEVSRTWKITVRNINQLPTNVRITSPTKLNFTSGTTIEFAAAVAIDPDDPDAVLIYQWKDNDASLGSSATYKTSKLGTGVHKIVLIVTDPDGASVTDEMTIRVKAEPKKPFLPGMDGMALVAAIGAALALAGVLSRRR